MVVEPVIVGAGGDPEAALTAENAAYEMTQALGRAHDAADNLNGLAMLHRIIGDPAFADEKDLLAAGWKSIGRKLARPGGKAPLAFDLLSPDKETNPSAYATAASVASVPSPSLRSLATAPIRIVRRFWRTRLRHASENASVIALRAIGEGP